MMRNIRRLLPSLLLRPFLPLTPAITSVFLILLTPRPTNAQTSPGPEPWTNHISQFYYLFAVLALLLGGFMVWGFRRRRRARKLRVADGRQSALLRDAAAWPRQRHYFQHEDRSSGGGVGLDGAVLGREGGSLGHGSMGRRWVQSSQRMSGWWSPGVVGHGRVDGLDERGEAPPPYVPKPAGTEGIRVQEVDVGYGATVVTVAEEQDQDARKVLGKPPDYHEDMP